MCCWRLPKWKMLCPELRAGGEGPAARMIGEDFLAKLLSRWIYPGLVLVDSGTFSLLSRFRFMTCHLLQQARREPLASSSRPGCRSGTHRHRCREPLAPFQERRWGLAGHPCPPLRPGCAGAGHVGTVRSPRLRRRGAAHPGWRGLEGWEGAAPAEAGGAGSCWPASEDAVPATRW